MAAEEQSFFQCGFLISHCSRPWKTYSRKPCIPGDHSSEHGSKESRDQHTTLWYDVFKTTASWETVSQETMYPWKALCSDTGPQESRSWHTTFYIHLSNETVSLETVSQETMKPWRPLCSEHVNQESTSWHTTISKAVTKATVYLETVSQETMSLETIVLRRAPQDSRS